MYLLIDTLLFAGLGGVILFLSHLIVSRDIEKSKRGDKDGN